MRKFSKIAASALALALSVTMVAPISANAYVESKNVKDGNNIYYEYTNTDTNKTYSSKDYEFDFNYYDSEDSYDDIFGNELVSHTITVKSYSTLFFKTRVDAKKIENFKSNKKNLKVRVMRKVESSYDSNTTAAYDFRSKDGKTYYYRDSKGEIQAVTDVSKLPKETGSGSYIVRLYAKKAGNYKLSYDVILKDGTKLTKTVNIIAKADGDPVKSVTFAGKSIYNSDKTVQNGFLQKNGSTYTTKKKGKIKITMNKDFVLKKVEYSTIAVKTEDYTSTSEYYDSDKGDYVEYDREKGKRVTDEDELNGNPVWKTVKNGKNVTLNKIFDNSGDKNATIYDKTGKQIGTTIHEEMGTTAETRIRITYYDKKNKETKRVVIAKISKLINK